MDIEAVYKSIQSIYRTLSGKNEADVRMTYKGTGYGEKSPWHVAVGDRECKKPTHDEALLELLLILKNELTAKVKSTEGEAQRLRNALNQLEN